jgi:hypothetical protein
MIDMAGLLDEIRKSELLAQAQSRLQGLLNIPTAAQQFMVSPASFMGLLGRNPLPRETGFAAGATGLPAQEMSVLDPNQAPYMQGYSQGEPVGYAGLALPLAAPAAVAGAKALGPKAGQALESYMVNQGMIQPLTAYHGTPHTIQGKFDINKVGTGEGNQTYGYGMYFAENPAVAQEYQKRLSVDSALSYQARDVDPAYINAANSFKEYGSNYEETLKGLKQAYKNAPEKELDVAAKVAFQPTGNLYKVDIPDADIPMMLDWDKPILEQTKQVREALAPYIEQYGLPMSESGRSAYSMILEIIGKREGLGSGSSPKSFQALAPKVAEELNKAGIKGIRYLDQGSRTPGFSSLTPAELDSRIDGIKESLDAGLGNKEVLERQLKSLQTEKDSYKNLTSNFVVFDPSDVKILEKNSEKVEGLLD